MNAGQLAVIKKDIRGGARNKQVFPILALVVGQFTGIILINAGLLWCVGIVLAVLDGLLMRGAAGNFTYEKLLR